jgi:MauM/NapG family ferredoxin protein
MARRHGVRMRVSRLRHVIQTVSTLAFFVLLTLTVWPLGQIYLGAFLVADPLIALNSAINGVWLAPMVLAIVMLLAPLLVGRAFCGFLCPMGAVVEVTSPAPKRGSRVPDRARAVLRRLPPYVLAVSAGLLLFSVGTYLFLDPLAMLTRSSVTLLYPLVDRMARLVGDVAYLAPPLRPGVDAVTAVLTGRIMFEAPRMFAGALLALVSFATVLAASRLEPRLWCRHICPLGALLGLVGRFGVAGRVVDASTCIACGRCASVCPMDAVGADFVTTDTTRCECSFECADVCPVGAISFGLRPAKVPYSAERRGLLAAGGIAALTGFFTFTGLTRRVRHYALIRPPGAVAEPAFLGRCSRCGQCMKVCPTNVLQPCMSKAGLEGVFTPEMDYNVGPCDWSCRECGLVCPTGAIEPLDLERKRETRIGRAVIDKDRCIPWADGVTCLVCQELCPIPDKAISLSRADVTRPDGTKVRLDRPEVIVDRCIGCGVCENACPVANQSAITVRAR